MTSQPDGTTEANRATIERAFAAWQAGTAPIPRHPPPLTQMWTSAGAGPMVLAIGARAAVSTR